MNWIYQIQPCYWRDGHQLNKRTSRSAAIRPENITLSENLSLFQSIQVITDDEFLSNSSFVQRNAVDSDQVCLKPLAVGAVIGSSSLHFISLCNLIEMQPLIHYCLPWHVFSTFSSSQT